MHLEEVSSCPICRGSSFKELHQSADHTVTHKLFHVKQCNSCGLAVTSPRPTQANASSYYQSDNYISHTNQSRGLFDSIYLIIRKFTMRWKLSLIKKNALPGPLLDFGCGTGQFLAHTAAQGITCFGVEPSASARKQINSSIPTFESLHSLPDIKFSVITLWHVLEHVYTLRETIEDLRSKLQEGGTIFIAVPNMQSPDANHYGSFWAAWDLPRHLWHFSKPNMTQLLEDSGFRVSAIIPMKLDAYYVSLLSEKYQHGGQLGLIAMLKAVKCALQSNAAAASTTNHSSLIFVAKK